MGGLLVGRRSLRAPDQRFEGCLGGGVAGAQSQGAPRSSRRAPEGAREAAVLGWPPGTLAAFFWPPVAWACMGPKFAQPDFPVMLLLIIKHLARELRSAKTTSCREDGKRLGELFRLDAKAEGETVAIGGWLSQNGRSSKEATWFAVTITRANAPLAFARGRPSE